ncbi:MAG: hypothetical protein OJF60_002120 [Burkholderiaceae bacterium]|jgi:uncharacterized integral membrane protein|nr:MAG: hypothetical protein OJF60_002120 [Burkholderiaceae bacterium]
MSIRTLLVLLLAIVIVAFVGLNWGLVMQPAELSLMFGTVKAPLGLVLLGLLVVLAVLLLVIVGYGQAKLLMESRRHAKELAAQRDLAERAEASRYSELKTFVAEELVRLSRERSEGAQQMQARIDDLQKTMLQRIDEQSNSLAAMLGQLDDHARSAGARTADSH